MTSEQISQKTKELLDDDKNVLASLCAVQMHEIEELKNTINSLNETIAFYKNKYVDCERYIGSINK